MARREKTLTLGGNVATFYDYNLHGMEVPEHTTSGVIAGRKEQSQYDQRTTCCYRPDTALHLMLARTSNGACVSVLFTKRPLVSYVGQDLARERGPCRWTSFGARELLPRVSLALGASLPHLKSPVVAAGMLRVKFGLRRDVLLSHCHSR